jgi:hypothetical protein
MTERRASSQYPRPRAQLTRIGIRGPVIDPRAVRASPDRQLPPRPCRQPGDQGVVASGGQHVRTVVPPQPHPQVLDLPVGPISDNPLEGHPRGHCPLEHRHSTSRVLVRAAPPGTVRVGEVDGQAGLDGELGVRGQFFPRSQVKDRRGGSGSDAIVEVRASFIATAPWPASAGPFFVRGMVPESASRGRCTSMVNRVERSTRCRSPSAADRCAGRLPSDLAPRGPRLRPVVR